MHGKGMRWSGLSPEDHPREKQLSLAASLSPNRDRVKSIKRNSMTIRIRSLQLCRAFPGYLDGTRKKREHRTAVCSIRAPSGRINYPAHVEISYKDHSRIWQTIFRRSSVRVKPRLKLRAIAPISRVYAARCVLC